MTTISKENPNKSVKYRYQLVFHNMFILKQKIITTENCYLSLLNNYHFYTSTGSNQALKKGITGMVKTKLRKQKIGEHKWNSTTIEQDG